MTYNEATRELNRLEAERACELPILRQATLWARAQRLLECLDPPQGSDRDFCYRLLSGKLLDS